MSLCVLPGGWGSWFFRRVDFSFFGGSFFLLFYVLDPFLFLEFFGSFFLFFFARYLQESFFLQASWLLGMRVYFISSVTAQ